MSRLRSSVSTREMAPAIDDHQGQTSIKPTGRISVHSPIEASRRFSYWLDSSRAEHWPRPIRSPRTAAFQMTRWRRCSAPSAVLVAESTQLITESSGNPQLACAYALHILGMPSGCVAPFEVIRQDILELEFGRVINRILAASRADQRR